MSRANRGRKGAGKGWRKRLERMSTHTPGGALKSLVLKCWRCQRPVEFKAAGLLCLQCERYQRRTEG